MPSDVMFKNLEDFVEISKALASDIRVKILMEIQKRPLNVQEIAEIFDMPASSATINVKKLENAKLIHTEIVPGVRGSQKICSPVCRRLVVELEPPQGEAPVKSRCVSMPIGQYTDCEAEPTCGLVSEEGIIGYFDDPRSFFEPEHVNAQLLWFKTGFVEYRFPRRVPYDSRVTGLELSAEICSEAPQHNDDWPSDITLLINGIEVGGWMSPGDFGGKRGLLTPLWWSSGMSQYGMLKKWSVNERGSFVDGIQVSSVTIKDLGIDDGPSFTARLGVKKDALNKGGMNIFGRCFGNYNQDILVRLDYEPKNSSLL